MPPPDRTSFPGGVQARESRPRVVVLVGLMGVGKTTVGKSLARRLHWNFVDSDHEIQLRTGVSIPTIFEIEGEAGFRRRESAVLQELCGKPKTVLATGGGAVLDPLNRKLLHDSAFVTYLSASANLLWERTRHDRNRPLLQVADPLAKLTELRTQRHPLYQETAHLEVDVVLVDLRLHPHFTELDVDLVLLGFALLL